MGRSSNYRLERANKDLMDWASWYISHMETSCIGYAARTAEGRAMKDGVGIQQGTATSRCPDVMKPPHIHRTEQSIQAMPPHVQTAIYCKYYPELAEEHARIDVRHTGKWTPGRQTKLFKAITGKGSSHYESLWRIGQAWVAGGLIA